jgi:hypothetical protein
MKHIQDHAIEARRAMDHRVTSLERPQPENGNVMTFLTSKKSTGIQTRPNRDTTMRRKWVKVFRSRRGLKVN